MKEANRIFFEGNPYPDGHKISDFVWSGRFEKETGLWFDFHLETEKYYSEDNSDDEIVPKSDWEAKIAWKNFHKCTISSTEWHYGGVLVGSDENKLDFENLDKSIFRADKLPLQDNCDYEDLSFYIYLLGHDSCADHEIKFVKRHSPDTFDIAWKGKIALTYKGEEEFRYKFSAFIEKVKFQGFDASEKIPDNLNKYVVNSDLFEIQEKLIVLK